MECILPDVITIMPRRTWHDVRDGYHFYGNVKVNRGFADLQPTPRTEELELDLTSWSGEFTNHYQDLVYDSMDQKVQLIFEGWNDYAEYVSVLKYWLVDEAVNSCASFAELHEALAPSTEGYNIHGAGIIERAIQEDTVQSVWNDSSPETPTFMLKEA